MSGANQQQRMQPPYIGSKISLISKLDIRYEGTLYTVDPIESTIALAKVHSYGTEDRRTPVFVPPRDEVYDFIIFKASDIKDLIVCEQSKAKSPPMATGLPYDPAIVSISKNPPPEPKLPPKLSMMNAGGVGGNMGAGRGGGGRYNMTEKLSNCPSFELVGPMRFNYRYPNFQPSQTPQPWVKRQSGPSNNVNEQQLQVFDMDYDFEKANEQFREKIIEDQKGDNNKGEPQQMMALKDKEEAAAVVVAEKDEGGNDGGDTKEQEENDGTPTAEQQQQQKQPDEFYNKTLSFFDNISCDALEKEAGKNVRPDWKRERQTNQETFGHTAVRNLFYQQRGGRGFGGGGGGGMMPYRKNNMRPDWNRERHTNQETFGHTAVPNLFYQQRGGRGYGGGGGGAMML